MPPTIFALSWRDLAHKKAGGAEVYSHAVYKRLVQKGWRVIHLACAEDGLATTEVIDGVHYHRRGNMLSVIQHAHAMYRTLLPAPALVIDQCNTHRFFTRFWLPQKQSRIFFIHQLTRELWFQEDIVGVPVLNKILQTCGYLVEPLFLWLESTQPTMTVCASTKQELERYGFHDVTIVPEGKDFIEWPQSRWPTKAAAPTLLYVGRYTPYKRVDHIIRAFLLFLKEHPTAHLHLVGNSSNAYADRALRTIARTAHEQSAITWHGFVSEDEKIRLMSTAHALLYTSKREGWGIGIIEAACVGTPSIVYDVPGLRDAVDAGAAGVLVTEQNPRALAEAIAKTLDNTHAYETLRHAAYHFSKTLHWDRTADCADDLFHRIITT